MKQLALLFFALSLSSSVLAAAGSKEKPTQHLKIADIASMQIAKEVFIDNTAKIRSLRPVDPGKASQIHIITYTLEKSVAFFAANLSGDQQQLAEDIAVVVEDIHIASENSRLEELEEHITRYFTLTDKFLFCF